MYRPAPVYPIHLPFVSFFPPVFLSFPPISYYPGRSFVMALPRRQYMYTRNIVLPTKLRRLCKRSSLRVSSRTAVHRQEDLLRDILDTATHYVTRYSLGCDMLN